MVTAYCKKEKQGKKNCNQEQPENCKLLSAKFVKATSFCTNSDRKEGSSDQKHAPDYIPLLCTLHIQQAVHYIKYYMQVKKVTWNPWLICLPYLKVDEGETLASAFKGLFMWLWSCGSLDRGHGIMTCSMSGVCNLTENWRRPTPPSRRTTAWACLSTRTNVSAGSGGAARAARIRLVAWPLPPPFLSSSIRSSAPSLTLQQAAKVGERHEVFHENGFSSDEGD